MDEAAIRRAQRVLGTKTETETIQKALELVADEAQLAQGLKNLLDKGKGHILDPSSEGAVVLGSIGFRAPRNARRDAGNVVLHSQAGA